MRFCLLLCCLIVPWAVLAQGTTDFYTTQSQKSSGIGFRTGINYSTTRYSTEPNTQLGYLKPRAGFYVGSFYYKDLSVRGLAFRTDASIQERAVGRINNNNVSVKESKYYHLGITPQIGLRLARNLTAYAGPEVNLLIGKTDAFGNGYPIEVGATTRFSYKLKQVGIEAGYFRSFTKYEVYNSVFGVPFNFYNQNWQIGVTYNLFP